MNTFWEMMYQVVEGGMWARLPGWPIVVRLHDKLGQMYLYNPGTEQWLIPYMPTITDLYETSWEYVRAEATKNKTGGV